MFNYRLKELRGPSRRNFLRFMGAAGASLSLSQSSLLNFLSDSGGTALADDACPKANKSLHIVCGSGSFAWFQLLWPHVAVAESLDPKAAYHAFGEGLTVLGQGPGDKAFHYGPEAPWLDSMGAPTRPVTAFMAGDNETHKASPVSAINSGKYNLLSAATSLQSAEPVLVPVIGVLPFDMGNAPPSAPAVATVSSAAGLVDLFNSEASKVTLLAEKDKALFETYYNSLLGLRYVTGRPPVAPHKATAQKSAKLLGINYSAGLSPTALDTAAYGIDELLASNATTTQKQKLGAFGRSMIVAARALRLGLTNSVVLGFGGLSGADSSFTDPHEAFDNMAALRATVKCLGKILHQFYEDVAVSIGAGCSALDQQVILTVHGDTPHTPLERSGWLDPTPGASNWLYVMGNGYLHAGWFGGIHQNGQVDGFEPATGNILPNAKSDKMTAAAAAAALFAIAKGDKKRIEGYYDAPNVSIDGLVSSAL